MAFSFAPFLSKEDYQRNPLATRRTYVSLAYVDSRNKASSAGVCDLSQESAKSHEPKHRQPATRLSLAFVVLLAVLMAIGHLGLSRIDEINSNLQDIVGRERNKVRLVREALSLSNANSRITMEIFLLKDKDEIAAALATRAENSAGISKLLNEIERRCESQEERDLLLVVRQTRGRYIESYQRALHLLVDEKDREAGTTVMVKETLPKLRVYHDAWNRFLQLQNAQMDAAIQRSRVHYARTHRVASVLILLAMLVAGGIAIFAIHDIASEMKRRVAAEEEVSSLNRELEQRVSKRTEELSLAERRIQHSLTELREYTQEVEAVNQIVELLQSCFTLDEAYRQVARALSRYFPTGALFMVNSSRNQLDQAASWDMNAIKPGPFLVEGCWAIRRGRPHAVGPDDFGQICAHVDEAKVCRYLCVPMLAYGESLGVIYLEEDNRETEREKTTERKQKFAVALGEQISLALANLQLRETLKYQSVRDPLTGLFNRRHMEESLQRELHRAARYQKQVPVLMMDLDHFKQFNDNFGHEAGDILLREFGGLMTAQTRGSDIACRYGGEEFVVILVDAALDGARKRAEMLREQVRTMQVKYRGEILRRVTVSIGIAAFPEHGTSAAQLLNAADRALYKAKAEGRDRVLVAYTEEKAEVEAT